MNKRRQNGKKNNRSNNRQEVFINTGNDTAKIISEKSYPDAPEKPAKNIIEKKVRILHLAYSRQNRRECPDYGHKAGKNDRFAAVFFVKDPRAFKMGFVKKQ